MCMVARCCGPGARVRGEFGEAAQREVHFERCSFGAEFFDGVEEIGARSAASISLRNVRRGSRLLATILASISSPFSSATPRTRPSCTRIFATGALVRIFAPWRGRNRRWRSRRRPCLRARIPTGRDGRSRRPCSDAEGCRRCRASAGPPLAPMTPSVARVTFSCFGFEPLVQKIGGALGEDFHQPDDFLAREAPQLAGEL